MEVQHGSSQQTPQSPGQGLYLCGPSHNDCFFLGENHEVSEEKIRIITSRKMSDQSANV